MSYKYDRPILLELDQILWFLDVVNRLNLCIFSEEGKRRYEVARVVV
jgi:hypothetical protein